MAATFYNRLAACIERGDLTTADVASWFDRPYHTVWFWIRYKREPRGTRLQQKRLKKRLELLEYAIAHGRGIPAPIDMRQNERPRYIIKIRRDLEHGEL